MKKRGWNEEAHAHLRTHGHKSGGKRSKAYIVWVNLKARCDNSRDPGYKNYGGRGIGYESRWATFSEFLADMGEPPSGMFLDRIDNDGDYCRENCRWATRQEQNLNKRNIKRYEFRGKTQTLGQWASELGIKRLTLRYRLQHGVPIEDAFTLPVLSNRAAGTALINLA